MSIAGGSPKPNKQTINLITKHRYYQGMKIRGQVSLTKTFKKANKFKFEFLQINTGKHFKTNQILV